MSHFSNLKVGEVTEFHRVLIEAGFTAELVRRISRNPSFAVAMFAAAMLVTEQRNSAAQLIHGMYNSVVAVRKATLERLVESGFTVDQFTWIGSETPPDFTQDTEVVVALDVTLATLQDTIEFACEWAGEGQEGGGARRWEGLQTTPDKLRLLDGSEAFQPFTLRWRRIKLDANIGKAPKDVRDPKTSPGIVLIFVAAQHPAQLKEQGRMKAQGRKIGFYCYIPGIECTAPAPKCGSWNCMLYVGLNFDHSKFVLRHNPSCFGAGGLSVPVFWE